MSLMFFLIKISAIAASSHASLHVCLAVTAAVFGAVWWPLSEPRNAASETEPCTGKLGRTWAVSGAAVRNPGLGADHNVIDWPCIPRRTNQGLDCQVCSLKKAFALMNVQPKCHCSLLHSGLFFRKQDQFRKFKSLLKKKFYLEKSLCTFILRINQIYLLL